MKNPNDDHQESNPRPSGLQRSSFNWVFMAGYRSSFAFIVSYYTEINSRKCHEGPEGEQRYSSTLSLLIDGDDCLTPRPGRFTPGKDPVPTV
jgi:hypothetical protein